MQTELLDKMSQQLEIYLKDKGISQNECSKRIGIASSYITHALNKNWDAVPAGNGRTTRFSDQVAKKIMVFLGIDQNVWEIDNYMMIMNVLIEAKKYKEHRIIDGQKGSGKTFTCEHFKKQVPHETFLITASEDMSPKDFMIELARQVGTDMTGTRRKVRLSATDKLKKMGAPIIMIDESENLKLSTYGSIKALYDDVKDYCSIVLIGANNYLDFLRKKADSGKGCFPQLYSRFSADPALLNVMDKKDVKYVCQLNGITDKETVNFLFDTCRDYRELDRSIKRIVRDSQLKAA